MSGAAAARAGQSEQPQTQRKVIYLCVDDQYENAIAQKWAESKGRKYVTYLPLPKLTHDMVIVPIVRGKERTPVRYEEFDKDFNRVKTKEHKPATLIGELVECEPVNVVDFWMGHGRTIRVDDWQEAVGGDLDRTRFIDGLARSTSVHEVYPKTHHGTNHERLTLGWGT